jgi:hypothetical protein
LAYPVRGGTHERDHTNLCQNALDVRILQSAHATHPIGFRLPSQPTLRAVLGLTSYLPWTTVAVDDRNLAVIGLSAVILENVGLRPAIPSTARIAVRVTTGTNRIVVQVLGSDVSDV